MSHQATYLLNGTNDFASMYVRSLHFSLLINDHLTILISVHAQLPEIAVRGFASHAHLAFPLARPNFYSSLLPGVISRSRSGKTVLR